MSSFAIFAQGLLFAQTGPDPFLVGVKSDAWTDVASPTIVVAQEGLGIQAFGDTTGHSPDLFVDFDKQMTVALLETPTDFFEGYFSGLTIVRQPPS